MNSKFPRCHAVKTGALAFVLAIVPILTSSSSADTMSARKHSFFLRLYKELDTGDSHIQEGLANPETWVVEQKDRLEPLVVAILRGERDDVPWDDALTFVAQLMPTSAICGEVYARMESMFSERFASEASLDEAEHGTLSKMVAVLAAGNDKRATAALNEVLLRDEYAYSTGRRYIIAAGKIGDRTSLRPLREMPLRKTNVRIDREAALTERIIEARINGKPFPPETATGELRAVTKRFLDACQTENLEVYASCWPWGFHEVLDRGDMLEFVDGEYGKPALAAIRAALDANTPFQIDRESLQAKLLCGARYFLEYIYEVDGWKVMNIRPVAPRRARDDEPPVMD